MRCCVCIEMPVPAPRCAMRMLVLGGKSAGNISMVSHLSCREVSLISPHICMPCQLWCGVPSSNEVPLRSQLAMSWGIPCPLFEFTEATSGLQATSAKG